MSLITTLPLKFPDSEPVCIQRRLSPYPTSSETASELSVAEFVQQLSREPKCYALLSAAGTGKTSLLREIRYRLDCNQGLHSTVVVGPIDMSIHRREPDMAQLLLKLRQQIAADLEDQGFTMDRSYEAQQAEVRFGPDLEAEFVRLRREGEPVRVLLLLDNFEDVPLDNAVRLGAQLRHLYESCGGRFLFVLASDTDLATLYTKLWSPLAGIVQSYTLADFSSEDLSGILGRALWHAQGFNLAPAAWERLYEQTRGYPHLGHAILDHLAQVPAPSENSFQEEDVERAIQFILTQPKPLLPFQAALNAIVPADEKDLSPDLAPIDVVLQLLDGETVTREGTPGTSLLAIKGVVDRRPQDRILRWRNPMIRRFLEAHRAQLEALLPGPELPRLESMLYATGTIYVSLFIDLRRFFQETSKAQFERLRGSETYAQAVRELATRVQDLPASRFCYHPEQDRLVDIGEDLDLFRERVVRSSFMPFYQLRDPARAFAASSTLKDRLAEARDPATYEQTVRTEWQKWHRISLQLTRDGTAHLCLEQDISKPSALIDILNCLLGLERELTPDRQRDQEPGWRRTAEAETSVQWEIILSVVELFIRECFGDDQEQTYRWPVTEDLALLLTPGGAPEHWEGPYPLRNRYAVYVFDKICSCGDPSNDGHRILRFGDLDDSDHPHYTAEVASLLESVMVEEGDRGCFPEMKRREERSLLEGDLSSWEGELFVVTTDDALIYCRSRDEVPQDRPVEGAMSLCARCQKPEKVSIRNLYFPQRTVSYRDYWLCVVRGLQYVVELRMMSRLVAAETTNLLTTVADLVEQGDSPDVADQAEELRIAKVTMTRLLSHLRDASIPMFIASADYGIHKYNRLIEISGIPKTIEHAEANIREVNDFLRHYDSLQEQKTDRRIQWTFTLGAALLAVLATVLTVPSFWIDLEQSEFAADWSCLLVSGLRIGIPAFIAVCLAVTFAWLWRQKRLS